MRHAELLTAGYIVAFGTMVSVSPKRASKYVAPPRWIEGPSTGRLVSAPRIRPFLDQPGVDTALDWTGLPKFLRYLYDRPVFAGIWPIPHASVLAYRAEPDTLRVDRYWQFADVPA